MAKSGKRGVLPQDFYKLRTVIDPQVSADGRQVAYVQSWSDEESDQARFAVYVAPLDGRGTPRRFTHGDRDHSPRWSPDGRYLAFVSSRDERKNQLFVAPLAGGEARQLTKAKFGAGQPAWSPDSTTIAYAARTGDYKEPKERKPAEKAAPRVLKDLRYKLDGIGFFDERRLHVFTVDVESGESKQLTDGDWYDEQPSWSPDGGTIAFVSDRERERHQRHWRHDVWVVPAAGGRARKVTRSRGDAGSPRLSPDGRSIAYIGHEHGDAGSARNAHLLVVPAAGGRAPRSVSAPLDRSAFATPPGSGDTFAWSRDGRSLLFLAADGGAVGLYRAGVANGSVSRILGGDRQIEAVALTADGRRAAYTASWMSDPGELYVQPLAGAGRPRRLSDANATLRNGVEIASLRRMTYVARDGLEIEAFVLYPPGYKRGRRYPLALQIHGGPHGMHPTGFQVTYQALAAAGYVVLLPNPRGSASYGEAFTEACVGDWGGEDYHDLMSAVDLLEQRGVADPERLCVGGYSYGGFMTSWVVGHTNRFRAAAVGAPVSNMISMFGEGDIPLFDIYEMGGTPFERADEYRHRSPVSYLPNVKTPVLLLHWEGDLRCPIGQSEEIFQGLKVLGKKVEFVRYPGGSHGVRTPSQAVDQLRRTIAWYERYSGAKGKPARKSRRPAAASRNGRSRNGLRLAPRKPSRAKKEARA